MELLRNEIPLAFKLEILSAFKLEIP